MVQATKSRLWLLLIPLLLVGLGRVSQARAEGEGPLPPIPLPTSVPMSNDQCLSCHITPFMYRTLPDGSQINLTLDRILFNTSVHGREGLSCVQCHTEITGFPHPELTVESQRELTIQLNRACATCHVGEAERYRQGDHARLLTEGNTDAAVCSDCHGAHHLEEFGGARSKISAACRQCHAEIYDVYRDSVHGKALIEEFNPDVPTCIDCHSNHANAGPAQRSSFLLFSPQICARCHADEELMARYEINTNVFETYVADFHGTTVTIFEQIAPDQIVNKPVCVDCHGVHNILPPTDENSSVMKDNLVETCRRCHPEANLNFPDAWMSHYTPDWKHTPLVTLVQWFYNIVIPLTIGGMTLFVVTHAWRTRVRRRVDTRKEGGS